MEQNLKELSENWEDSQVYHRYIHEHFIELVNHNPELKKHRDYVENNIWGFGERSFWWLWKVICNELPEKPSLLEIGVFRAATLSLWRILKPNAFIFGVTPMDNSGGMWESDYPADIYKIHEDFKLIQPYIYPTRSDDEGTIKTAGDVKYDVVYIDGSHEYTDALNDLNNYSPMVKKGGYLVIDDCNNNFDFWFGAFGGIVDVTNAKLEWLKSQKDFKFVFSVVHISVFERI